MTKNEGRGAPAAARMAWLALWAAALSACATHPATVQDAERLMAEREAAKALPTSNISQYAHALERFGQMLDVYKDGDPVVYIQTRQIADATNLSNPLVGSEIPGDVTEMVRTAVNRIGARVVYVPFHPDYLLAQAQLGAKFGVTMPDYLITGALTQFERAIVGAGRSNNLSLEFGGGKGETSLGAEAKNTAIISALGLDLNLVSFSTNQMVPRVQAANVVRVFDSVSEANAALGFYGDSFGFKLEGRYLQGRHSAIRTLVDLSVLELLGKATSTPYWRCLPNGQPDPVVVGNMRRAFEPLAPALKIGLAQVLLRRYGEDVAVNQQLDQRTRDALARVYSSRFPQLQDVDILNWASFEPLFFGVPMPWDNDPAMLQVDPAPNAGRKGQAGARS